MRLSSVHVCNTLLSYACLVSNSQLHGGNSKDAALIQQWISFSDNEILPASCTWIFPCLGITQYNKQVRMVDPCVVFLLSYGYEKGVPLFSNLKAMGMRRETPVFCFI